MKTQFTTLIVAAFAASVASPVWAEPPGKDLSGAKTHQQAASQEEILKLKKGHRYAVVCTDCKSITMKQAADDKEAATLCHEGGTLHCDGCKKKFTIKYLGSPGKEIASRKVTIVNAEGKECMFIVPMKD